MRKGDTVGEFLKAVKMQLAEEFRDIRWAAPAIDVACLWGRGCTLTTSI